jgi:hypothetical protein
VQHSNLSLLIATERAGLSGDASAMYLRDVWFEFHPGYRISLTKVLYVTLYSLDY